VAPDGSGEKLLYQNGGYPAWSPDGEQIAYINLTEWCLWVMNKDGTGNRKLTDHSAMLPAWSADGLWIAYERDEKTVNDKFQTNIWIINVDGSGSRKVIEDGLHPDW
jgi:TolB protein